MSGEALMPQPHDEIERLRRENQLLREGRLELVRELNRIIALGDFAMRCATAEEPADVLDRALALIGSILDVDHRVAFGLRGDRCDLRAFVRRSKRDTGEVSEPGIALDPELAEFLRNLPVATIQQVDDANGLSLAPLLDVLFPEEGPWSGATVLILPLRPRPGQTTGAIVACKRIDPGEAGLGPHEDDATFLVLLSNHVDRALQSALLVSDLRARGEDLAESTRRFKDSLENLERTQRQLLQARKLEAIGRLAGGVAHDFNNLLTVIRNHVEFLGESFPAGAIELEDVQAIGEATDRATRITRQLLAFGRRDEGRPEVLDVNAVATELTRGLGRLVGEHIKITLRLEPSVGPVRADRAQLEQVLLNLLVNARDAMPSGGVISLSTRHATPLDFSELSVAKDPAQFLALVVSDTGVGMDEPTRARLFEPFFTTKEPGFGTGLGLATVYGIIEKHGGHIAVTSAIGRGTTFTVLLPAARRSSMTIEAVKAPPAAGLSGLTGTILLVEDDANLRRAALRALRSRGYDVIEARDGEEALYLANAYREKIDLVLTDVVMPKMSGPKLVTELRARRPDIHAIYVSGYTFDMLDPSALEDGSFLTKPFSPDDLIGAVRAALSETTLTP